MMSALLHGAIISAASFGLWFIVGRSRISLPARRWLESVSETLLDLLECPACFGFWEGFILGMLAPFMPEVIKQYGLSLLPSYFPNAVLLGVLVLFSNMVLSIHLLKSEY